MPNYRADVIGSMLRPASLLQARERRLAGTIDAVEFKRIEDGAVDQCLAIQQRSGVDVVTDGEMRRNVFASQLAEASEGFAAVQGNTVDWFTLEGKKETSPVTVGCVGKIRRKRHLAVEEFVYLRAKTDLPIKITLPSPTMYAYYYVPGVSSAAYPTTDAYLADVTEILRDEVAELVRLGARYVQFDAPEFGMLLDDHQRQWFAGKGFDPDRTVQHGIELINAVMEGQPGIVFGLHICRGNDATRYMAKGGYARLASMIFPRTRCQRLLLEYDDERSGDFEALARVPEDKTVVLGLITTKRPRQETADEVTSRVREAARFVPMERLAVSTQCGFASVAKGNAIPFDLQERKLRLVTDVARKLWPDG